MSLLSLYDMEHRGSDGVHRPREVEVRRVSRDAPDQVVCRVEEREDGTLAVVVAPGVIVQTAEVSA